MKYIKTISTESGVTVRVERDVRENTTEIKFQLVDHQNCLLHWGIRRNVFSPWQVPPRGIWPAGSQAFHNSAVQTPFVSENGQGSVVIRVDPATEFRLIDFVLFFPEEGRWDNNRGRNYRVDVPWMGGSETDQAPAAGSSLDLLSDKIIEKEMSRNSWTLMHRYNLCYDLLDEIRGGDLDGMTLIYVWLRFSAMRQLDWQRNYNTKPRELGHAMDRLTMKLAYRYVREPGERGILRLIMATLGRGSNAQQVRDEVLNIMHRHNIKEVSGHFMEEWHQKLHNNTTPDDVVICEAYLEFLRSGGNIGRFYQRLEEGGVTKERLESFERPIRSAPDFIPHLRDALIRDFEHFLGILKEVHAGADLGIAIHSARYLLDPETHGLMDFIWGHQNDPDIHLIGEKITEARTRLAARFEVPAHEARDLLFLDIALEDFLRVVVERSLGPETDGDGLVGLIESLLANLCLSKEDDEMNACLHHWKRLADMAKFEGDWSVHAESVLERIRRLIGSLIDTYHKLLQPKAEFLGKAFQADKWTVGLFSEEVLRGQPVFVLSMALRYLDPILRKMANIGDWQLISRGHGAGEVEVIETLKSVQGKSFGRPVVLVAEKISGDEEIPQGVSAIITPSDIDSLSHLAIRARNAGVLFSVCFDPEKVEELRSLEGRMIKLSPDNAGNLVFEESGETESRGPQRVPEMRSIQPHRGFTGYAIPMGGFGGETVGYKSNKLRNVSERLPDWIGLPASVALPFGVFERTLAEESNSHFSKKYNELGGRIKDITGEKKVRVLSELRRIILELEVPAGLADSLRDVMDRAGIPWPSDWGGAWTCIRKVWASKWNDRACLSREANGIAHEDLLMSVLIQRVVESDYSFVIHTVNPFTGAKDEIYAEVVSGLGETLAANYPGRALSFSCPKGGGEPRMLSFPSKSTGLYGGGIIFRSDSNGEDLAGYAGAGLYDSFIMPQPRRTTLDYTGDQLVWDAGFRKGVLLSIRDIGALVESAMEYPQDIEGAYARGRYFVVQTRPQVGIEND